MHIPGYVAFALALHVGDSVRGKATLEWLNRPDQRVGEDWNASFLCAGLWEAPGAEDATQRANMTLREDDAVGIATALRKTLQARSRYGKQKVLAYETATRLFQRYAAAAWRA